MDPATISTLVGYGAALAIGWLARHKGILAPKTPAGPAGPAVPAPVSTHPLLREVWQRVEHQLLSGADTLLHQLASGVTTLVAPSGAVALPGSPVPLPAPSVIPPAKAG